MIVKASQLYQLRGHCKSSRQAYAYLIKENIEKIKENSLKKLQLVQNKSLGAGFSIATNDLDIKHWR